jgi:DNA repair exonuclease SbcCD ATPase subunit
MTRTRSRNHTEVNESVEKNEDKGKRQLHSPQENASANSKKAKLPTANMGDDDFDMPEDKWKWLQEKLESIDNKFDPLSKSVGELSERILNVETTITAINVKQVESDSRTSKLESAVREISDRTAAIEAENNLLQQKLLIKQFTIFNVPSFNSDDTDNVIKNLSKQSQVNFSGKDLNRFNALPYRSDKSKCVIHGEFHDLRLKTQFLAGCRRGKDSNKRPIVAEDIVRLHPSDPRRGSEIFVSTELTRTNRDIKFEARQQRLKGKLQFAWEKDGRILVKTLDDRTTEVRSMIHLMSIVNPSTSSPIIPEANNNTHESMQH